MAEENTIYWLLLEKRTLPTSDHNITAFPESIFKNYMRSGKDFSTEAYGKGGQGGQTEPPGVGQ